jgi:hypothetical protein
MSSDEIQSDPFKHGSREGHKIVQWLREIAYQLAKGNERPKEDLFQLRRDLAELKIEIQMLRQEHNQVSGSPVGADSDKTVRADICAKGWHRFKDFLPTKPRELPPDDWQCLNCGWTRAEIDAEQHADERVRPDPQADKIQT